MDSFIFPIFKRSDNEFIDQKSNPDHSLSIERGRNNNHIMLALYDKKIVV